MTNIAKHPGDTPLNRHKRIEGGVSLFKDRRKPNYVEAGKSVPDSETRARSADVFLRPPALVLRLPVLPRALEFGCAEAGDSAEDAATESNHRARDTAYQTNGRP